ncbi:MAG: zf-TFIIB domain-containing protein [Tabrizicola sp.]
MRCPVDGETLVMTDRSGVEIDYCPKCRGVWLDRGELDKIIDRSLGGVHAAPAPTPQAATQHHAAPVYQPEPRGLDDRRRHKDEDDHRQGYRKKRRDSFLSDLFDF